MTPALPAVGRGLADSISIAVGYIPVAISFGLAAVHAGLSPLAALLISCVVYAGASQFLLLSLFVSGAAPWTIILLTCMTNARHLVYGPTLLAQLPGAAPRRFPRPLLAAGLTDEVFATAMGRLATLPDGVREPWYVGLQLGAYLSWLVGTGLGAWFGSRWLPDSVWVGQTLDFVLPALFFALLLAVWQAGASRRVLLASASATLLAGIWLPVHLSLITGIAAGMLTGIISTQSRTSS